MCELATLGLGSKLGLGNEVSSAFFMVKYIGWKFFASKTGSDYIISSK